MSIHHKARTDVQQSLVRIRRGDGNARHAFEPPEQFAVEVIRTHFAGAGGHDFGSLSSLPDKWRGPIAAFVAVHPPDFFAGAFVQSQQVRLLIVVVDQIEPVSMQHRRSRRAPAGAQLVRLQRPGPDLVAFKIQAKYARVADAGINPLAVRHWRLRGISIFDMFRTAGLTLVHDLFPADFAGS